MSKPNLKPCPFCGGTAGIAENYGYWVVYCKDDCEPGINPRKEFAIESWNTRAEVEQGALRAAYWEGFNEGANGR